MSNWLALRFTQYKGKSLPQIIFMDPNWFFWACEMNIFKTNVNEMLAHQARVLFKKATHIKPRFIGEGKPVVEYFVNPATRKFSHIKIVPEAMPSQFGNPPIVTKAVIDWSVPRNLNMYDKKGGDLIVKQTKSIIFGIDIHMSRGRCEGIFDDDRNFDLAGVNWATQF